MSEHAIQNAKSWMESIHEMVEALEIESETSYDDALQAIYDSPLSFLVRSGWTTIDGEMTPEEYEILLSTGGPALRIIGSLGNRTPCTARLEWQDWGTPWTTLWLTKEEEEDLLAFAEHFYG